MNMWSVYLILSGSVHQWYIWFTFVTQAVSMIILITANKMEGA